MKIVNFDNTNSLMSQLMLEMRSVTIQNDRMRFRRNLERAGQIMAYEISKTFEYRKVGINTPLGVADCHEPADQVVLATIFRAGLPFHQGFLSYFDRAENAFVSAYRKYREKDDFDILIEYLASPSLDGKTLIICDPMLATGASMELSYKALLTRGTPRKIHLASVVASMQAVDYVRQTFPENTTLWVGAIDDEINAHSYIVPGLGDAGDLAFGTKL
ncbi:MAG: uracil phosphoribosyltransferase [Bacteroides sp.]|nr:uracil phosphoribosyltransferase [Bacteroides sp.]MCM1456330.1 uracil phosphoribosyltransferase [Lachnoclostridium sp.]